MPQGSYVNDISKQKEMDQEQVRVTLSGNQRIFSGVLQEGVLREAAPHPVYVTRHCLLRAMCPKPVHRSSWPFCGLLHSEDVCPWVLRLQ